MIRSEKAVSEVIGMVMILSIMMLVIGAIMLVAVPMIESGKERARMDVAANSFLSLQNDIEEVVRGPIWVVDPKNVTDATGLGPSRMTEFELMDGTLTVLPNMTDINYYITNTTIFKITIPPSNISFNANEETIIFENGAVIRKYEGGLPLMLSNPLINIYDNGAGLIVVSIHAISINGTLSSTGGDGKGWAEIRLRNYNQTIEPEGSTGNSNRTSIIIYSKYPEAWKNFFDEKLTGAKLTQPAGYSISGMNPLVIQINGSQQTGSTKDILLSVYESSIDVKVR